MPAFHWVWIDAQMLLLIELVRQLGDSATLCYRGLVHTYSAAALSEDAIYTNRRVSPVGVGTPPLQEVLAVLLGEVQEFSQCVVQPVI